MKARQRTYYNAKLIEVSTPTVKGASPIETFFLTGTHERWCHRCQECGKYTNIIWDHVRFKPTVKVINHEKFYDVNAIGFAYPHCGCITPEEIIRRQPAKWIAENPDAIDYDATIFKPGDVLHIPVSDVTIQDSPAGFWGRLVQ